MSGGGMAGFLFRYMLFSMTGALVFSKEQLFQCCSQSNIVKVPIFRFHLVLSYDFLFSLPLLVV